jgi:RNA polymerase sigma-70 factor, ECF subfamily
MAEYFERILQSAARGRQGWSQKVDRRLLRPLNDPVVPYSGNSGLLASNVALIGRRVEPLNLEPGEDLEHLRAALARAVARICPHWLSDQADDLVQVALMKVIEVLRRSEGSIQLKSFYLHKAAYSALVDEIRRRRRRREVPLPDGEGPTLLATEVETSNPETQYAGREVGREIRDCLAGMIHPRRRAAALHLQGHSVPEISRLLGWSGKKAENLVYRGLADLRQCLAEKGVTPWRRK